MTLFLVIAFTVAYAFVGLLLFHHAAKEIQEDAVIIGILWPIVLLLIVPAIWMSALAKRIVG